MAVKIIVSGYGNQVEVWRITKGGEAGFCVKMYISRTYLLI